MMTRYEPLRLSLDTPGRLVRALRGGTLEYRKSKLMGAIMFRIGSRERWSGNVQQSTIRPSMSSRAAERHPRPAGRHYGPVAAVPVPLAVIRRVRLPSSPGSTR